MTSFNHLPRQARGNASTPLGMTATIFKKNLYKLAYYYKFGTIILKRNINTETIKYIS